MSWPSHAHTAADREHAGREGGALTEEELARALCDVDGMVSWTGHIPAKYRAQAHALLARLAAQPVPAPSRGEAEVSERAVAALMRSWGVADDDESAYDAACRDVETVTRILRDAQPTDGAS